MDALQSVHVVPRASRQWGGQSRAGIETVRSLTVVGSPSILLSTSDEGDDLSVLTELNAVSFTRLFARSFPKRFSNSSALVREAGSLLKAAKILEIHGVFDLVSYRVGLLAQRLQIPYVVRPHGALDPFDLRKKRLLKTILGPLVLRSFLQKATAVLCTTTCEAKRIRTFGAEVPRMVCPLPVSSPMEQGSRTRFRARYGIPDGGKVVCFLSRIDYKKGLEILIPSLGRLQRHDPDVWFVIAGGGDSIFVRAIQAMLKKECVHKRTIELGWIGGVDKSDLLAGSDLFALPSLNENFCIAAVESLIAGTPVAISENVYLSEAISNAGAGWVLPRSIDSWTEALSRILADGMRLRAVGEAGSAWAKAEFSLEGVGRRTLSMYRELLYGGGCNEK